MVSEALGQLRAVMARDLATLGKLTATVGRELRNPLAAIRASAFTFVWCWR